MYIKKSCKIFMRLNAIQNRPSPLTVTSYTFFKARYLYTSNVPLSQRDRSLAITQHLSRVMEMCLSTVVSITLLPCKYTQTLTLAQIPSIGLFFLERFWWKNYSWTKKDAELYHLSMLGHGLSATKESVLLFRADCWIQ